MECALAPRDCFDVLCGACQDEGVRRNRELALADALAAAHQEQIAHHNGCAQCSSLSGAYGLCLTGMQNRQALEDAARAYRAARG